VLATVLFTDIVSSIEQLAASGDNAWGRTLDEHDRTMERLVAGYRGRVVKSTGDGILATFDGPARAVRCAAEMIERPVNKASRCGRGSIRRDRAPTDRRGRHRGAYSKPHSSTRGPQSDAGVANRG
jgi:class 3 adenylate cyclase